MRLIALAGIVSGLTFGVAGQASAAVLYEQVPSGPFTSTAISSHDHATDTQDAQAADDFTISDGQVWTIQGVDVLGANDQVVPTQTAAVTLYSDGGGVPGTVVFAQSGIAIPGCPAQDSPCNFTAAVTGAPALGPGTYWVSVQTNGAQRWFWALHTPDATYGNPAVWQNPGNGSGQNCLTYTVILNCNFADIDASDGKDLVFALTGTVIDSRFSIGNFTARGLKLFANPNFPAAGSLVISGKGIKRKTASVAAGGQRIRLKLKGGVLDRLRAGRKAKLRVKMTFTATGGDGFSQSAKIKLVPRRAGTFRLAR